jgi:uncharacterized membrane protein HdeD (DUF308 family)
MSGPTAAATPAGSDTPSAPPLAGTRADGAARSGAPTQRWHRVGLLVIGLLTVLYGLLVMSLRPAALTTIVVLAAFALIGSGIAQIGLAGALDGSWRWAAVAAGVIGIAAGVAAFVWPGITLLVLAVLTAWSFVINGVVRIVGSVAGRDRDLWWLGLLAGAVELLLGLWAIGSPGREVLLLVNLIGIFLVITGVDAMVTALARERLAVAR